MGYDRKAFKWSNGRSIPYPNNFKENVQNIYPNGWVVSRIMEKYGRVDCYPPGEEDELNIRIRCNVNSIIMSLSTMFNL